MFLQTLVAHIQGRRILLYPVVFRLFKTPQIHLPTNPSSLLALWNHKDKVSASSSSYSDMKRF